MTMFGRCGPSRTIRVAVKLEICLQRVGGPFLYRIPHGARLTCLDLCQPTEPHGGACRMWLERRVARSDRTYRELQTLSDALHLAGTWYEHNMGASSCCERIGRRIQAICDAYQDAEFVTWNFAHFHGGSRQYTLARLSPGACQSLLAANTAVVVEDGGLPPPESRGEKGSQP